MLVARSTSCVFRYAAIVRWFCAVLTLALVSGAFAQSPSGFGAKPQQPYLDFLHRLQQQNAPPAKLGYAWALLASSYEDAGDTDNALQAYDHALSFLSRVPEAKANYATALDNLGEVYLVRRDVSDAETVRMKALQIRTELGDPIDLARSHEHIAELELAQHRFKQAEQHAQAAADTLTVLRERDHYRAVVTPASPAVFEHGNTLLSAYVTLTYAQCLQSAFAACMQSARKADELSSRDFAPDSIERAHTDMALGFAQWKNGDVETAEQTLKSGLAQMKTRLGEAHPIMIAAMYEYREFLKGTRRKTEAAMLDKTIQSAEARSLGGSCPSCTVSVFALR